MNTYETLGYQLRIPIAQLHELWTSERRDTFLLVPEIKNPISADDMVWPCMDNQTLALQLFQAFYPEPGHAPNGLNLYSPKEDGVTHLKHPSDGVLIAIGAQNPVASYLRDRCHFLEPSDDRVSIPELNIRLLGFDVCDEALISELMNCGLSDNDNPARLRKCYARFINQYGLFDDLETATNHSSEMSTIIPEHAPFFPISISQYVGY